MTVAKVGPRAGLPVAEKFVDGAGCSSALLDSPNHQRLPAAAIARGKDPLDIGGILWDGSPKCLPVGTRTLRFQPQTPGQIKFRPQKAGCKKDQIGRQTVFGHKLFLTCGASRLILDCEVVAGNPADQSQLQPLLQRQF